MKLMKLKELESILSNVSSFDKPKVLLEQYSTSPHLASYIIHTAQSQYGDFSPDSKVLDLGTGSGMLSIACAIAGVWHITAVDVDLDALSVAAKNINRMQCDSAIDLICLDLSQDNLPIVNKFDTVITNPPFGTKIKNMDVKFLSHAINFAPVVYSLHKSSTREYLAKKARSWECSFEVVAEIKFDIPQMYKFHKKKTVDVMVDLIRLEKKS